MQYLAKNISSKLKVAPDRGPRGCIIVDESILMLKDNSVYVCSCVDADSLGLLALEASFGRSSLNALKSLKKALEKRVGKPMVMVDKGP